MKEQEKSISDHRAKLQKLELELLTGSDRVKALELQLQEAGHQNEAKTQELVRVEDEMRAVKSQLNASQLQCENAQETASTLAFQSLSCKFS